MRESEAGRHIMYNWVTHYQTYTLKKQEKLKTKTIRQLVNVMREKIDLI